ncbi:MAG: hypothetical protein FWG98_08025 [Candidatus Cloacimonetes bacterium]|nr:hypothetical protein [Candidatus Cloacimonadota bacterium]
MEWEIGDFCYGVEIGDFCYGVGNRRFLIRGGNRRFLLRGGNRRFLLRRLKYLRGLCKVKFYLYTFRRGLRRNYGLVE